MSFPTVLSLAGSAINFAGQSAKASGSRAQGAAALQAAEFNKSIRDRNARVAEQEAALRERIGEREVTRFRDRFQRLQASTATKFRKGGVVATSGTPLQVLLENANEAEEDVQLIGLEAATDASRFREQARNQRLEGEIALLEGGQRRLAANTRARTQTISSFANLASGLFDTVQIA